MCLLRLVEPCAVGGSVVVVVSFVTVGAVGDIGGGCVVVFTPDAKVVRRVLGGWRNLCTW